MSCTADLSETTRFQKDKLFFEKKRNFENFKKDRDKTNLSTNIVADIIGLLRIVITIGHDFDCGENNREIEDSSSSNVLHATKSINPPN